jgi:hypothetical protein
MEPPPRATIRMSGRGGDFARGLVALDGDGPHQHGAREAVAQAMENVANDRAGGRGNYADHGRQIRQRLFVRVVEQALGGEFLAAFFE